MVVDLIERGRLVIKLVAENDRQVTNAGHTLMTPALGAQGQNVWSYTTKVGF